jgi:hypothetical protein
VPAARSSRTAASAATPPTGLRKGGPDSAAHVTSPHAEAATDQRRRLWHPPLSLSTLPPAATGVCHHHHGRRPLPWGRRIRTLGPEPDVPCSRRRLYLDSPSRRRSHPGGPLPLQQVRLCGEGVGREESAAPQRLHGPPPPLRQPPSAAIHQWTNRAAAAKAKRGSRQRRRCSLLPPPGPRHQHRPLPPATTPPRLGRPNPAARGTDSAVPASDQTA